MPIVLNTESKSFSFDNLTITTLHLYPSGTIIPWGQRLIAHLDKIQTEYVLLMLDDFFLCQPVKEDRFVSSIRHMEADSDIAAFCFYPVPGRNYPCKYPGFLRRPQCGAYKYNCQAGLWRTKELRSFLRPHESAWVWEVAANYRSWRSPQKFYCAESKEDLIFDYYGNGDWSGIMRGKWYTNYVEPLFKKHGIEVDFSKRGTIDKEDVSAIVNGQDRRLLYALKTLYGNTLCLMKNPRSLF